MNTLAGRFAGWSAVAAAAAMNTCSMRRHSDHGAVHPSDQPRECTGRGQQDGAVLGRVIFGRDLHLAPHWMLLGGGGAVRAILRLSVSSLHLRARAASAADFVGGKSLRVAPLRRDFETVRNLIGARVVAEKARVSCPP
eukprot:CAMPEP_0180410470 /NCGR_PEP_ID=MMETSP0989-20121125/43432_1 /TAXON_ID=697907 /ORGANISM="non described non described, Strain CCMP2293" /LENGTH=138 /DNA_ID=CAMNT_0022414687 /DNA_START=164 /DNA_END=579 /DNA_ORIENTATION=-